MSDKQPKYVESYRYLWFNDLEKVSLHLSFANDPYFVHERQSSTVVFESLSHSLPKEVLSHPVVHMSIFPMSSQHQIRLNV